MYIQSLYIIAVYGKLIDRTPAGHFSFFRSSGPAPVAHPPPWPNAYPVAPSY